MHAQFSHIKNMQKLGLVKARKFSERCKENMIFGLMEYRKRYYGRKITNMQQQKLRKISNISRTISKSAIL